MNEDLASVVEAVSDVLAGRTPPPLVGETARRVARAHGVAQLLQRDPVLTLEALQLTHKLRTILDELRRREIPVMPIKGPVLAMIAYGDAAARGRSLDLDLVIRKPDLERAIEAVCSLGYTRVETGVDEHDHEEWESEAHLFPIGGGSIVELQTELIGSMRTAPLRFEAVLSRATTRSLFGTEVVVPEVEDLILYLCLHAGKHGWDRLIWLCDVAALIRAHPALNWQTLIDRADSIDARRRLGLGVHLASTLLGLTVPANVQRALFRGHGRRTTYVVRRMEASARGEHPHGLAQNLWAELVMRDTLAQRVRYLANFIGPTARDRAWVQLPRGLGWVHWLLRPIRLAGRYLLPRR